jgi:cytochrome c
MLQGCLYGLPEAWQTGYVSAVAGLPLRAILHRHFSHPPAVNWSRSAMDSHEINKVLGAILGTCLVLLSLNITAGALFAPHKPAKPGFDIVVPEHPVEGGKIAEPEVPFATLLASSDVARGENAAKKCIACHSLTKGGPNLVGPNLWGIVGRAKASIAGFNYSSVMKSKTGNWTVDDLNIYLLNPKAMVPGTAMNFPGIPKGAERADVIAYLNSRADSPAPLPKAAEAPAAAPTPSAQAGSAPKPAAPAAAAPKPH